jgi:SagB-type dehydrogenase family enzyme
MRIHYQAIIAWWSGPAATGRGPALLSLRGSSGFTEAIRGNRGQSSERSHSAEPSLVNEPTARNLIDAPLEQVYAYHQRTKHHFRRYAASAGYLDWATQPDPFRRYRGAPRVDLPLIGGERGPRYDALFQPRAIPPEAPGLRALGLLLELSFGLSAWKEHGGDRWALRCNPSSGNLHPTEAYLVSGGIGGLADGVYHYLSFDHSLQRRCAASLPFQGIWVALSSIFWREAWKYGERAFRYCQHDVGHALGALVFAAGSLGWTVTVLDDWSDDEIGALLGLDRAEDYALAERESPDLLAWISFGAAPSERPQATGLLSAVRSGIWCGQGNTLSEHHQHDWPVIEQVHRFSSKPRTPAVTERAPERAPPLPGTAAPDARLLIRQRRSAQSFDGGTVIPVGSFYRMLDATLPRAGALPFHGWPWRARVHLLLFVHRVTGLTPGLYILFRCAEAAMSLRAAFGKDFAWSAVAGCPAHWSFFRLLDGDARGAAKTLSCHQDIASDGIFSLAMLAEFDEALAEGAWVYRRLFWETGLVGQVLYLEAEAAGVRGTGIGCFFDDPVHELLGLSGTCLQSLYHFTVGAARIDDRLQTLPPYDHIDRLRKG